MEKKVALEIILTLLILSMFTSASMVKPLRAELDTVLAVDPPFVDGIGLNLGPGSTFYINVTVDDVEAMLAYQFFLRYDTSVLTVSSYQSYSPFTNLVGAEVFESEGYMYMVYSFPLPETIGLWTYDPFPMARIDFTVDDYGYSPLDLYDTVIAHISDPSGIPHRSTDGSFVNTEIHDVAITEVKANQTFVKPGQSIHINVTAENQGTFTETFEVTALYDSNIIRTQTITELAPKTNATLLFAWDPTGVAEGTYTLSANASEVSGETDTADNTYTDGTVTVTPVHDIAVTSITASPTEAVVGSLVSISVTVKNEGIHPETFDLAVREDTILIDLLEAIALSAGESMTVSFTWDTTDVVAATYAISANASVVPGETDTANNVKTTQVTLKWSSTITVSASPTTITIGQSIAINGFISPLRAEATVTILYRPTGENWALLANVLTDQASQYSYVWTPTSTGLYVLKASWQGDATTFPAESSITTVEVLPIVLVHDISVRNVEVYPTTVNPGEPVTITVNVENQGNFSETFTVTAYYDNAIIETKTVANLASGASVTLSFLWDTSGDAEGEYTIKATASPVPGETDTTDNTLIDGQVAVVDTTAPIASFTYTPTDPTVNEVVTFDASASTDNVGIVMYEWDFGDGTHATGMIVTHAYTESDSYTVRLTVWDAAGNFDTATTTITVGKVLSIKLSGEFDYLIMENAKIKIVALIRDVVTMEPVSNANVTIQIYDDTDNLWISSVMIEKLAGTGIYEWTSSGTIRELRLQKGVYLARVQASYMDGPTASDILLFHIDPPAEGTSMVLYHIAFIVAAVAVSSGLLITRRQIVKRLRKPNRHN